MGNASTSSFRTLLIVSLSTTLCALALSGCMTLGKGKQTAQADAAPEAATTVAAAQQQPDHPMTPAEQLAASLNAKAETQLQKPGGYRDPMVRTVNGQQMVAQQSTTALYPAAPMPQTPAGIAAAPANIGGLVTQPTAVNANRSSIYSAPPPIAVNPDGTLAGPVSAYTSQGASPAIRSVYSTPAGMNDAARQQQQLPLMNPPPQASQAPMPQYAAPPVAAAEMRPTADATPHRILPVPGSKQRTLSSQEALTVARNAASQGRNPSINASIVKPDSGLPTGLTLPPGVSLTPGMSASLKQPI